MYAAWRSCVPNVYGSVCELTCTLFGCAILSAALQASWHPGSSSHFAVLASDNRWRLYHTGRLTEAEQTFWLRLPGSQVGVAEAVRMVCSSQGLQGSTSSDAKQ